MKFLASRKTDTTPGRLWASYFCRRSRVEVEAVFEIKR